METGEAGKAVVLVSGGVDSATCLALAAERKYELFALSFNYHQRHRAELAAARRIAALYGVREHLVLDLPLNKIGGSALTADLEIPKDVPIEEMSRHIPATYVPARNTIFLAIAVAWAEVLHAGDIFIGVNALDYSGYPDCRPQYVEAFEKMANLATRETVEGEMAIRIRTPLIKMTKAEIILEGSRLGLDYSLTHSCYDPDNRGRACGHCDSCILRRKGFEEAGIPDPTIYSQSGERCPSS